MEKKSEKRKRSSEDANGQKKKPDLPNPVNKELDELYDKIKQKKEEIKYLDQSIYLLETEMFRESGPLGKLLLLGDVSDPRKRSMTSINPNLRLGSQSSSTAVLNVPEFAAELRSEQNKPDSICSKKEKALHGNKKI